MDGISISILIGVGLLCINRAYKIIKNIKINSSCMVNELDKKDYKKDDGKTNIIIDNHSSNSSIKKI